MIGWVVAAYLAGALALVMVDADGRWHADELAMLAGWPLTMPAGWLWMRWRRRRSTCRVCGRYYGTRERLERHRQMPEARGWHSPPSRRP